GASEPEATRLRLSIDAKAEGVVVALDSNHDIIIDRFNVAPAGTNAALAIDEPNRLLFVGCRRNPSVVVMNSDTGKIIDRVPIPGDVDDIYLDARRGRIYASCGDGAIAVIRPDAPDRYAATATIPTVERARTSIVDPDGGRLYLAVPRRASRPDQQDPEVWVYQARP